MSVVIEIVMIAPTAGRRCARRGRNALSSGAKCVNEVATIPEAEASQIGAKAVQTSAEVGPVVVDLVAAQAQVAADRNVVAMVARRRAVGVLAGVKRYLNDALFCGRPSRVRWLSCFMAGHSVASAADVGAY